MPGRASYGVKVLVLARFAALVGVAVMVGGCAGHAQGAAHAEVETPVVFTGPPTLVEVEGGVWVVRDYDYPVYFVDDDYWVYREGIWYRSHAYEGGWVRIEENVVPMAIARRDHRVYIHYHGVATAHTRPAPRRERGPEPHHDHPEHADNHHGHSDPGQPEHAAGDHHGDPHHDDSSGHAAPGHDDHHAADHHAADHHNGPPAHAAQQHGGPPGHDEHSGNKDKKQDKGKDDKNKNKDKSEKH